MIRPDQVNIEFSQVRGGKVWEGLMIMVERTSVARKPAGESVNETGTPRQGLVPPEARSP